MINKYPYTDFHELNLDWFLAEFKKVMDRLLDLENAFATLKEYIDEYFKNLDLQEEVNNYFNSLIESGEFYNILNKYFGSDLVDESLYTLYAQVVPDRNNRFDLNMSAQGFCIGKHNNRNVCMACFINGTDDNNTVVWTYMDTGLVLNTITLNAGHSNSCCYNPDNGHWYIACGSQYSPRNTLMEIDTNGAVYQESMIDNRRVWGITYNQGKLYALLGGSALGIINPDDWDDYTVITGMIIDEPAFTYQGLFSDDNFLYVPNGNRITNVPQGTLNLNRISVYTHNGMLVKNIISEYPPETEEGDILDGVLYMNANTTHASVIVKADLYSYNRRNNLGLVNGNVEVNQVTDTIYIDETYTDFEMTGSSTKPLSSIALSLLYLRNSVTRLNLEIQSDISSLNQFNIRKMGICDVLDIEGNNHMMPNLLSNVQELYINNCIFEGRAGYNTVEYYGSRLVMANNVFGTSGSTIKPSRLIMASGTCEISTVTVNQEVSSAMFYLMSGGYINALTVNPAVKYPIFYAGDIHIDGTFPVDIFIEYPYRNTIPVMVTSFNKTIDLAEIYLPMIIQKGWGGTFLNIPAGLTYNDIQYIIATPISQYVTVLDIVDNSFNHTYMTNTYTP